MLMGTWCTTAFSWPFQMTNTMLCSPTWNLLNFGCTKACTNPPDGLEYGYFLNFGLTSLVIVANDGRSVEVGIVGREGIRKQRDK